MYRFRSIALAGAYIVLRAGLAYMQQCCAVQLCHGHAVMIFDHGNGACNMGINMTCDHIISIISSVEFFSFRTVAILSDPPTPT